MNKKLLFIPLAAFGLIFSSCGNQGPTDGDPNNPGVNTSGSLTLLTELEEFLDGRGITGDIEIPSFSSFKDTDVLDYNTSNEYTYYDPYEDDEDLAGWFAEYYGPSFDIYFSGDVTATLNAGFSTSTWNLIPNSDDTDVSVSYIDSSYQISVYYYFSEADATEGTPDYTYVSISAAWEGLSYIEYEPTSWPADLITRFLKNRGVTGSSVPSLSISSSDIKECYESTYLLMLSYGYYPCFTISFNEQTKVEEYVGVLRNTTGWTVPDTQGEWGFECISPDEKVEIDCFYGYDEDAEGYVYSISIYSYADLTSGGTDDPGTDDPGTDDPGTGDPTEDITVNPDGSKTATFDFSSLNHNDTITTLTTSDNVITMTSTKASGGTDTTYINNGNSGASLRIYWGSTITFTASGTNKIEKVEFVCVEGNSKTVDVTTENVTVTGGTLSVNDKNVTITATEGGVSTLSFYVNLTKGNIAIGSLSITYR